MDRRHKVTTRSQSRKGTIREDGREDAQETSGANQAKRKEEQAS